MEKIHAKPFFSHGALKVFTWATASVFANRKLFAKRSFWIKRPRFRSDKKLMQIVPRRYLRLYDRRGDGANIQKLEEAIKRDYGLFTFSKWENRALEENIIHCFFFWDSVDCMVIF